MAVDAGIVAQQSRALRPIRIPQHNGPGLFFAHDRGHGFAVRAPGDGPARELATGWLAGRQVQNIPLAAGMADPGQPTAVRRKGPALF